MKKMVIKGIFICLLSIILMSHNTYAATLNFPVKLYAVYDVTFDYTGTAGSGVGKKNINGDTELTYLTMHFNNFSCDEGDYIELNVNFFNVLGNNSLDAWVSALYGGDNDFSFISTTYEQLDNSTGQMKLILYCQTTYQNQNKYLSIRSSMSQLHLFAGEYMSVYYLTRYKLSNDFGGQLSDIISSINAMDSTLQQLYGNSLNTESNVEDINDKVTEHYEQENDAYDNISNQDASDLQGDTDNQASTNLIGLFQSFITALTNITQANNCNLTLNFPSYAGGAITVNVCQYKDKGGNIVAIFSSLTLIVFYIPLALKLLSMIYNEIRSFTNG